MTKCVLIVQLEITQICTPQFIWHICPNRPIIWDIFEKISHHSFSSILGPDLPVPLTHLAIVSFEDTVITVAGHGDVSGGFHQLKCDEELSCHWTTMAQKLKQGRYWPVAIKIPDELANCIESEK